MVYKAIVMGGSKGLMQCLLEIFACLPESFEVPIIVVAHIHPSAEDDLVHFYREQTHLRIREAEDKASIKPDTIYFAPPDYHLLVEPDITFSLNKDEKVNYARPSIDVLFKSAGFVFGDALIAVLMTGANYDGAEGIRTVKRFGGLTIAQTPDSAECPVMPQAAIDTGHVDKVFSIQQITDLVISKVTQ